MLDISMSYDSIYQIDKSAWYKAPPYAFKVDIDGGPFIFYLPLNPNNITINTSFANNSTEHLYIIKRISKVSSIFM